jgi:hypothetical protein
MNKLFSGIVLGLIVGSGVTWLALRHPSAAPDAPNAAAAPAAKTEEKPNPLRMPAAKRAQAGIVLARPVPTKSAPEVQGYGRVLDATSLASLVSELETARAALAASEKEAERAKKLFAAGGNASAQAVETAQAAVARDRAAATSAQTRLISTWGRDVAQNLAPLSDALEHGGNLVRIDLLPGENPAAAVKQARLSPPGSDESFSADVLGAAPVADSQVQGASFLALVHEHSLSVGAALRAAMPGAGEATTDLVIPRSAVVYHQGSAWIFELGEEDTFERKLVTPGRVVGDGIVISTGLEGSEQVVTTGAQQLLAAELQAGGAAQEP